MILFITKINAIEKKKPPDFSFSATSDIDSLQSAADKTFRGALPTVG
jgi:hypothetical protein